MKKEYAVIGDPIAHSMSPVMHNTLFSHYNIDAHYERILIKKSELENGIKMLKNRNISGFNVTVPHKEAIIPFLDEVDSLARSIGAVNTVVNNSGKLIGYNTDGLGYIRGLELISNNLKNKVFLIIGAGGAARAIFFTLAHYGVKKIDIANRTIEKAEKLILNCPYDIDCKAISLKECENNIAKYDVIIQTTSIGMSPNNDKSPILLTNLTKNTIVSDIIYNPLKTSILKIAEQQGAIIQNGLPMFVYQGALAFEKWTGILPDTAIMEQTVLNKMKK